MGKKCVAEKFERGFWSLATLIVRLSRQICFGFPKEEVFSSRIPVSWLDEVTVLGADVGGGGGGGALSDAGADGLGVSLGKVVLAPKDSSMDLSKLRCSGLQALVTLVLRAVCFLGSLFFLCSASSLFLLALYSPYVLGKGSDDVWSGKVE